jgi:hypothetical protein
MRSATTGAFSEADARWAAATGTGSVTGRVFVIMRNDSERVGRNTTIDLAPATPYYAEIIAVAFARNRKLTPGDPRAKRYVRTVPTKDEGEFEFHHLPAGDYFVGTDVQRKHSFCRPSWRERSTSAPVAPHRAVGRFDVASEAGTVHQRGGFHAPSQCPSQLFETSWISRELPGDIYILVFRSCN